MNKETGHVSSAEKNNMFVHRYADIVNYAKVNGYVTRKEFPTNNTAFKFIEAQKMIQWIKEKYKVELTFVPEDMGEHTSYRICTKNENGGKNDLGMPLGSQLNSMLCGIESILDILTKRYE